MHRKRIPIRLSSGAALNVDALSEDIGIDLKGMLEFVNPDCLEDMKEEINLELLSREERFTGGVAKAKKDRNIRVNALDKVGV